MSTPIETFIRNIPKAELHLHIEGTLEPELMFAIASRNNVPLNFPSVEALREAYNFSDLQSFLDLYYQGMAVLQKEEDFFEMTMAYLKRAREDRVRHAEIFFDPQAHTSRGVPFETVLDGIHKACLQAEQEFGITFRIILCFLRHLSAEEAFATLRGALPHRDRITAVGLDSSELGHPPSRFAAVFEEARREGFRVVAHAGEEGPAEYIWEALDMLKALRIDHGVRCMDDEDLVNRLRADQIPLTVCPLSNVRLRVFPEMRLHNLKRLLERGLVVTINSDDPAYFGGYLTDNFLAAQEALGLGPREIQTLVENSFHASFLRQEEKERHLADVRRYCENNAPLTQP
ncbi:adenosine deaminase [Geomonas sp. RF6]|uniref:adenosine deaminase n=1 Tax=Geomonas sp. RF6 TaxID=2897342 RepID=UPI001E5E5E11|nr:adenosine deaminase [Geomonas sp. RF6]UFS69045.1 adenosine deaminase [Geomonas sp. RF6]